MSRWGDYTVITEGNFVNGYVDGEWLATHVWDGGNMFTETWVYSMGRQLRIIRDGNAHETAHDEHHGYARIDVDEALWYVRQPDWIVRD